MPKEKRRIKEDIIDALTSLEPRITGIDISILENDTNTVDVRISYIIRNGLVRDGVDFTVSRVR